MENRYEFIVEASKNQSIKETSIDLANYFDSIDNLREYRNEFEIPLHSNGSPAVYLNGNSLGLMPKSSRKAINDQLDKWSTKGGKGHFEEPLPWFSCDEGNILETMAEIVGSKQEEVVVMNQLTVNLHLMLTSFYRPSKIRYKILCEFKAFPSDKYAFESHIEMHGFNPETDLISLKPRDGEFTWRMEDIEKIIREEGDKIALVCFSGIHYFTGQLFNIERITKLGHQMGCLVGWDLAHTIGNVPLKLHDWNVDFAVWCSYKYLNSGCGGIGGAFVNEKHFNNSNNDRPYLKGWWGHRKSDRMQMTNKFHPANGALRFRLSNPSFTAVVLLKSSLDIFKRAGIANICEKSRKLTNYLEYLITKSCNKTSIEIITPRSTAERGAQLSLKFNCSKDKIEKELDRLGIIGDVREPNILRIAPCPLYNTFNDVYQFANALISL